MRLGGTIEIGEGWGFYFVGNDETFCYVPFWVLPERAMEWVPKNFAWVTIRMQIIPDEVMQALTQALTQTPYTNMADLWSVEYVRGFFGRGKMPDTPYCDWQFDKKRERLHASLDAEYGDDFGSPSEDEEQT